MGAVRYAEHCIVIVVVAHEGREGLFVVVVVVVALVYRLGVCVCIGRRGLEPKGEGDGV
jgi:hypothetical protein